MTTRLRPLLGIAGLALVAGTLVGCGGSDSAGSDGGGMPASASKDEFCANFKQLATDLAGLNSEDASGAISTLQDAAKEMASTGTPEGISDEARHGLEVTLAAISDLPSDATADDISNLETKLSEADQKDAEAFDTYLTKECGSLG